MESTTFPTSPVHGVLVSGFVQVFATILGYLPLLLQLGSSQTSFDDTIVLFCIDVHWLFLILCRGCIQTLILRIGNNILALVVL